VVALLSEKFASWENAPALVVGKHVISYGELAKRVEHTASAMGRGNKLIAVEAVQSEHAIVTYLAARDAGHAVALLAPGDSMTMQEFEATFQPDVSYRFVNGRWWQESGRGGDVAAS